MTNGVVRLVEDRSLLTVEQRDLGGLQHVAAAIALGRLDQEEGFDVAEDGEAEVARLAPVGRTAASPG